MPLWAIRALLEAAMLAGLLLMGNWVVELKAQAKADHDKLSTLAEQIRECGAQAARIDAREREIAVVVADARRRADGIAAWLREHRDRPVSAAGADQPADPLPSREGRSTGSADEAEIDAACAATSAEFRAVKEGLRLQRDAAQTHF